MKGREIKKKQEKLREKIAALLEKWQKEKETRRLIVSENEIADVVAGWTRIPVKKLAEEESERLKNLEGILHERVVGAGGSRNCRIKGHPQRPCGIKRSQTSHWLLFIPWPDRCGKDRAFQGSGRGYVGTETADQG